jgi:hypothetical protein
MKPKILIWKPRLDTLTISLTNAEGQKHTYKLSQIIVCVDNSRGRVSALDCITLHDVIPPSESEDKERSWTHEGWVSRRSGQRFVKEISAARPRLDFAKQIDVFSYLVDAYHDYLVEEHADLFKHGPVELAILGFGIEGFDHVYLDGELIKLPIEQARLVVLVSNRDFGDLNMSVFRFTFRTWDDAQFDFIGAVP